MNLKDFQKRYTEARTRSHYLMADDDGAEFHKFPLDILQDSSLIPEEQDFLYQVGLPQNAAPYLKFENLYEKIPGLADIFNEFFCLGFASRHRLLVADKINGEIQCLELGDEAIHILFVNSSLEKFAECLCLFEECIDKTNLQECYQAMHRADSMLNEEEDNFWKEETEGFIDNVLNSLNEAANKLKQR